MCENRHQQSRIKRDTNEFPPSSGKGFRDIAAAIIDHDTGHFHTEPLVSGLYQACIRLVLGDGGPEVDNSTERFFIGMDLAKWIWLNGYG